MEISGAKMDINVSKMIDTILDHQKIFTENPTIAQAIMVFIERRVKEAQSLLPLDEKVNRVALAFLEKKKKSPLEKLSLFSKKV